MAKCGIIQKLKEQSLAEFVAEHRPHFDETGGPMDAHATGHGTPELWVSNCSCGSYWVGASDIMGEVFGR